MAKVAAFPQNAATGFFRVRIGDILHSPFHGHGTDVSPPSVQAPGGLLDGVTLCLICTSIWVVQQDLTDVEHGLHARRVLLYVSLQVLPLAKEQCQWKETCMATFDHALSKCCRGWGKSLSLVSGKAYWALEKTCRMICADDTGQESHQARKGCPPLVSQSKLNLNSV